MDEFLQEETRALVRAAVADHVDVDKVVKGPRSTEFRIDLKDGSYRVVTMIVRDQI